MANYKTKYQVNLNWVQTFQMKSKAPAVANRIFEYFTDAQSYVDNIKDSATEGIRITVLKDYILIPDTNGVQPNGEGYIETKEYGYAGVYYVESIGYTDEDDVLYPGVLVKIGRSNFGWFKGNAVTEDGSTFKLFGSKTGDLYLNDNTLNLYELTEKIESEQTIKYWKLIANLNIQQPSGEHIHKIYYILSDNNKIHPEWDKNVWSEEIPTNYEDFDGKSVYLWSRIYDVEDNQYNYLVSLVHSSLNLGTFKIEKI